MKIFYMPESKYIYPMYDCIASNSVHLWDPKSSSWFKSAPVKRDKKKKIQHMGRVLPTTMFSFDLMLEALSKGYQTIPSKRGHIWIFLYMESSKWDQIKEDDIYTYGMYHDTRYDDFSKYFTKEDLGFSKKMIKKFPATVK